MPTIFSDIGNILVLATAQMRRSALPYSRSSPSCLRVWWKHTALPLSPFAAWYCPNYSFWFLPIEGRYYYDSNWSKKLCVFWRGFDSFCVLLMRLEARSCPEVGFHHLFCAHTSCCKERLVVLLFEHDPKARHSFYKVQEQTLGYLITVVFFDSLLSFNVLPPWWWSCHPSHTWSQNVLLFLFKVSFHVYL